MSQTYLVAELLKSTLFLFFFIFLFLFLVWNFLMKFGMILKEKKKNIHTEQNHSIQTYFKEVSSKSEAINKCLSDATVNGPSPFNLKSTWFTL